MGGLVFAAPLVGVHVAEPRLVPPFENCIEPVGPAPVLEVVTYAVNVTLVPFVTELKVLNTSVDEFACVMATESVLLVLAA
jgi:hypothetical protein